jgi:hypothetical protein
MSSRGESTSTPSFAFPKGNMLRPALSPPSLTRLLCLHALNSLHHLSSRHLTRAHLQTSTSIKTSSEPNTHSYYQHCVCFAQSSIKRDYHQPSEVSLLASHTLIRILTSDQQCSPPASSSLSMIFTPRLSPRRLSTRSTLKPARAPPRTTKPRLLLRPLPAAPMRARSLPLPTATRPTSPPSSPLSQNLIPLLSLPTPTASMPARAPSLSLSLALLVSLFHSS